MSYQIIIDLGQHLFTFIPGDHCLIIDDDITPINKLYFIILHILIKKLVKRQDHIYLIICQMDILIN